MALKVFHTYQVFLKARPSDPFAVMVKRPIPSNLSVTILYASAKKGFISVLETKYQIAKETSRENLAHIWESTVHKTTREDC